MPVKKCNDAEPCAGMEYALQNPPREGYGLKFQLLYNFKTGAESYQHVYYMRRSRSGDKVLKVLFCPFCGEQLHEVSAEQIAQKAQPVSAEATR